MWLHSMSKRRRGGPHQQRRSEDPQLKHIGSERGATGVEAKPPWKEEAMKRLKWPPKGGSS